MAADYKYDAFISYRHISPDKPVAERLQKLLEAYVPPKELRSGGAAQKLRLFRDETELPTSNDLGGDIKTALEQSRFLIVICSPALEQSKWCMQELDYFRSLHGNTNRQILTLLVNDPDQPPVFPEPLRYEPRLVTTEDGATSEVLEEIEPLAANVSAKTLPQSLKKLKTEFLRIAAPMLGCGYDDLYNREQRRRNKRRLTVSLAAAAVLAVAALLSTTALITISSQKTQIEADARELRRNNAELQLRESEMLESSGDLYGALEAVMQSLGDADDDVPASNGALAQAAALTGAYDPNIFTAVKKIDFSSRVTDLCLFNGGSRLAVVTSYGTTLWDTETGECIRSFTGSSVKLKFYRGRVVKKIKTEQFAKGWLTQVKVGSVPLYAMYQKTIGEEEKKGESAMYLFDQSREVVERISPKDGTALWSVPIEDVYASGNAVITEDGVLVESLTDFIVLDPDTGKTVASIDKQDLLKDSSYIFSDVFYCRDHLLLTNGKDGSRWLSVYRKEGNTFRYLYTQEMLGVGTSGHIAFLTREGSLFAAGYIFSGALDECTAFLQAYDLESGERKWGYDVITNTSEDPVLGFLEPSEGTLNTFPVVFAAIGDRFFAANAQTGTLLYNSLLPGGTEDLYYSENGFVFFESSEGVEYFCPLRNLKEGTDPLNMFRNRVFPSKLQKVSYENNLYAVTQGKGISVFLFRLMENDAKEAIYRRNEEDKESLSDIIFSADGSLAAISQLSPRELRIVSLDTKEVLQTISLGDASVKSIAFLGNDYIAAISYDAIRIYEISSGKAVQEYSKEDYDVSDGQADDVGEIIVEADNCLYAVSPGKEPALVFDIAAEREGVTNSYLGQFNVSPSGNRLFLYLNYSVDLQDSFNSYYEVWIYDRSEKTVTVLETDGNEQVISHADAYVWSEDETELYMLSDDTVWGYQCETGQQLCCAVPAVEAVDMIRIGDDLCLLNTEGRLVKIRAEGTELTELNSVSLTDNTVTGTGLSCILFSDGRLFVQYQTTGWMLDRESFEVVSRIDFFCGASEARNLVYTKYYDYLYAYPLLDETQIMARARDILQDAR